MREVPIDGETRRVRVHTEVDLIEISAVLIGANPSALVRAASAFRAGPAPGSPRGDAPAAELVRALRPVFRELFNEMLHPGPGSYLGQFVQDVGELWLRSAVRGGAAPHVHAPGPIDDPADSPEAGALSEGERQLLAELRQAMATARG